MTEKEILDIHILERKKFNLLREVLDLSKQIGESMDRNDKVSLRMLLGMRQEPIEKLEQLKEQFTKILTDLPQGESNHLRKILAGQTSSNKAEEGLKQQAIATGELLQQVLVLDERINRKIAGDQSVYCK
ncbi:MAG: hypothetical protein R3Y63_08375 [Eubacteriales bacterium]